MEVLTPASPRWEEFMVRMCGPEGCNFRKVEGGWEYDCGDDLELVVKIMWGMGGIEILDSIEYFRTHGGTCDCKVILVIDGGMDPDAIS